jgi:hypothetical protein
VARPDQACFWLGTFTRGPGSSTVEHLPCNQAIGVRLSSRAQRLWQVRWLLGGILDSFCWYRARYVRELLVCSYASATPLRERAEASVRQISGELLA